MITCGQHHNATHLYFEIGQRVCIRGRNISIRYCNLHSTGKQLAVFAEKDCMEQLGDEQAPRGVG